jgi:hypothetical protein
MGARQSQPRVSISVLPRLGFASQFRSVYFPSGEVCTALNELFGSLAPDEIAIRSPCLHNHTNLDASYLYQTHDCVISGDSDHEGN